MLKHMFISTLLILSFFSATVQSADSRIFYFNSSSGEEIKGIAKQDNSGKIQYTFAVPQGIAPIDAFYDYVKSTMAQKNFEYFEVRPCFDCYDSYSNPKDKNQSTKSGKRAPVIEKRDIKNKSDPANILLESAASTLGSRSVNTVFDKVTAEQNKKISQFQVIIVNSNRKPVGMCQVSGHSCDIMEDVTATSLSNDRFGFEISEISNMERWERVRIIESAIESYARSKRYTCQIFLTNSGGGDVKQIVCFPSY